MHEMVFILCIQSAIRRRAAVIMTSQTEEEFKKRVQKCSLIPTQILPRGYQDPALVLKTTAI